MYEFGIFFFVENEKIVKYFKDSENRKEFNNNNNIGIIGKVYKNKEILVYDNIKYNIIFNYIIDLESPSGLIILENQKKTKLILFNICQNE